MKITRVLAAAGLVIASLGVANVADAKDHGRGQEHRDDRGRDGQREDHGHDDHRGGNDRDGRRGGYDRDDRRHDNGNHYGWRNGRGHHRCYTEWRHRHRVRVCR